MCASPLGPSGTRRQKEQTSAQNTKLKRVHSSETQRPSVASSLLLPPTTASVEGNCPNGLSEEGTSEAGRASLASKPKCVRRSPAGTVSAHPGWSVGQCPGCLLVEQSGSSSPERARESHSPAPKLVLPCSRSPDPGLLGLVACDLPGTASLHQSFLFHPDGFSGFLVCSEFHILLQ